jgi:hypothetical protein
MLDIEQSPQGQNEQLDAMAQAAAQNMPPVVPEPSDPAPAIEESVAAAEQRAEGEVPPAPTMPPLQVDQQALPGVPGARGVMQAPAVMRQPVRTPFERDQQVAILWKVVAEQGGSSLTQAIFGKLSGID